MTKEHRFVSITQFVFFALLLLGWQRPAVAQFAPDPYLWFDNGGCTSCALPADTDIVMTRVQVTVTALYTYFETMGWNFGGNGGGYCGIQDQPGGKNYIFTLWDPASSGAASTVVYSNPTGHATHYTSVEGHFVSYNNFNLPWQVNQWYRLVARAWDYQGRTYFGLWSYDETGEVWTHHATFAFPISGFSFGESDPAFLEDFSGLTGQLVRRVNLNDGWGRSPSRGWTAYSSALFALATQTGPYANAYDAGVQGGSYYMQSGDNTTPTLSVNSTLTLPFTETAPALTVGRVESVTASYDRTANQITVAWVTDAAVSPQFSYQVDLYNNPGLTGSPIVSYSDTNPDVRSVVLSPPAASSASYYASVSITDIFDQAAAPVAVPVADTGTTAYVWPLNVSFGSVPVGATTTSQTVTLTNIGKANLAVSAVTIGGTNATDFAQGVDTCAGATVTPNSTCTTSVTFTPTTAGARSGNLTFTDNNNAVNGSTQIVALSGSGTDTVATLSPTSLSFPRQAIGTASAAQVVNLSNTGGAPLSIASLAILGVNAADFMQTNTCGTSVAVGANCTISVIFSPAAGGPRRSSLSIVDNASGSPQMVFLTGVGMAVSLSPASLTFATQSVNTSSPPQTVTLTNAAGAPLHVWQVDFGRGGNPGDFTQTNNCVGTLAAGANCTIKVSFTPTATGPRTATLLVSNDGGGSPQAVALTGTGG